LFAEWCHNQPQFHIDGEIWDVDKDIYKYSEKLTEGFYSPSSCFFVPRELNLVFVLHENIPRKYPIGVRRSDEKFRAEISVAGEVISSPRFSTIEEASDWYMDQKKKHIISLAEKYKHQLNPECYFRLVNMDLSFIRNIKVG
jgi:hypothetical protein